jgi:hydroxymethylpyrimidine/phosphomethylpyrimidine kinase
MAQKRNPIVLSIAGHDPSGGAGLLADCKTFEQQQVLGLGVVTAITYQTENKIEGVSWLTWPQIKKQLMPLTNQYKIDVVKIGLVKDTSMLLKIVTLLIKYNPLIKIVWDPILIASSGFNFHKENFAAKHLHYLLNKVYLVTPNKFEYDQLQLIIPIRSGAAAYSANWLIKSNKQDKNKVQDLLIENGIYKVWNNKKLNNKTIHGSGCILSAAISAQLALGNSLAEACLGGRSYVLHVIKSSTSLLGMHYLPK